ncbi:MAG: hypothetical protein R3F35_08855 [Myxococcota bacterium]
MQSLLSQDDRYLFNDGSQLHLHRKLGAHPIESGSGWSVPFAGWTPTAARLCAIGDLDDRASDKHRLAPVGGSGICAGSVAGARVGDLYKFHIEPAGGDPFLDPDLDPDLEKADPFAVPAHAEPPPRTASRLCALDRAWQDDVGMAGRRDRTRPASPTSIDAVHLRAWRRAPESGGFLDDRALAHALAETARDMGCADMGCTPAEPMPVMEHPFYYGYCGSFYYGAYCGAWGDQTRHDLAPTAPYGAPQDLTFRIDGLHRSGIGVILDRAPSHRPDDPPDDPRQDSHSDCGRRPFDDGRPDVRRFPLSSAFHGIETGHVDALRVDAVASKLPIDCGRAGGEGAPNARGGRIESRPSDRPGRPDSLERRRPPQAVVVRGRERRP